MVVTRKLFCRVIAMRDSDQGQKNTYTFVLDDLIDENEKVKLEIVYFESIPTAWKEILEDVSRNDRITVTIESGDRQTRLE